ncbi:MAG TPA: MgtC/SapB family protein [Chitinophagaceae bacterium]|jgi:putative Mg2+ transporter-C (MgtC) family protein|nr:MgtC/SapB family protein [Chitinophagaceae bacterium]
MPSLELLLLRLLLVITVSGLIGAEREYRSKSAGFRTMILIGIGSFLFTTFSIHISESSPDRIASNIVTGIGFLGAGVIFKSENRINGLTTAAAIWAVAALGMGVADGQYWLVVASTVAILVSLLFLTKLETWFEKVNQSRQYKITATYRADLMLGFEEQLKECGLTFKRLKQAKSGEYISFTWIVHGVDSAHSRFIEQILHDNTIKEFEF